MLCLSWFELYSRWVPWTKCEWIVNKISYIQLLYLWLVDNTVIGRQNIPHNRSIFFFGFEFRPHSIIPVTWNQYNIYSHTSGTYHSVEGHHWLIAKRTITKNRFVSPWKIVTLVGGGSIAIWGMEVVKKSRDLRSPEVGISVYGLVTRQIISLKVISLEILSQVAQNFIMLSN